MLAAQLNVLLEGSFVDRAGEVSWLLAIREAGKLTFCALSPRS